MRCLLMIKTNSSATSQKGTRKAVPGLRIRLTVPGAVKNPGESVSAGCSRGGEARTPLGGTTAKPAVHTPVQAGCLFTGRVWILPRGHPRVCSLQYERRLSRLGGVPAVLRVWSPACTMTQRTGPFACSAKRPVLEGA